MDHKAVKGLLGVLNGTSLKPPKIVEAKDDGSSYWLSILLGVGVLGGVLYFGSKRK